MLPTPSKFHYMFNMREISRIFKGITGIKKEVINTCAQAPDFKGKPDLFLVGLWRHQCERVFVDKLVDGNDK
jgi:dynein heavy chain